QRAVVVQAPDGREVVPVRADLHPAADRERRDRPDRDGPRIELVGGVEADRHVSPRSRPAQIPVASSTSALAATVICPCEPNVSGTTFWKYSSPCPVMFSLAPPCVADSSNVSVVADTT